MSDYIDACDRFDDISIESPEDIVRLIMTQHWDLMACRCWVCCAGRTFGIRPRSDFLGSYRQGFDRVTVPQQDPDPEERWDCGAPLEVEQ